jgi:hypothetical protein
MRRIAGLALPQPRARMRSRFRVWWTIEGPFCGAGIERTGEHARIPVCVPDSQRNSQQRGRRIRIEHERPQCML